MRFVSFADLEPSPPDEFNSTLSNRNKVSIEKILVYLLQFTVFNTNRTSFIIWGLWPREMDPVRLVQMAQTSLTDSVWHLITRIACNGRRNLRLVFVSSYFLT